MSKVKELQLYLNKVKNSAEVAKGPKREFFEREVRKTLAKIQELSK